MPTPATQRFPRDLPSVRGARSFVRDILTAWNLIDRTDEVLLCVSELASNAIRHGAPGGHFLVKVVNLDDRLRIEVHDPSRRRPRVQNPGVDDIHGRGLQLVGALADAWGVDPSYLRGKVVWSEFKIEDACTPNNARPPLITAPDHDTWARRPVLS
ncbi:MAG: ATP-binding protein [Streptomycetales bacterium]